MRNELLKQYYDSQEYSNKVATRFKILMECEAEPLKITKYAIDSWSVDPIAFIEQFGWIINPKFDNETKPFFLFEYQKEVIMKIWQCEIDGKDHELLVDKPREMGMTWVVVWYQIWRWLFTQSWSGFNLSRTETEVDDGSSDPSSSLFGKIRWSLDKLPHWLVPEGFIPKGKRGNSTDMLLRISNPQMASIIVGSTTNANAGRSRRYSFTFIDECFFIEKFNSVRRALDSVSNMKLFVSTAQGGRVYKKFVDKCRMLGDYISLTYNDNPFKDLEWFKEKTKAAESDPEIMREVVPSYTLASSEQYYPEISQAKLEDNIEYDPALRLYVGIDYGKQDHTILVFAQFDGKNMRIIEVIANKKVDFEWYAPFLNPGMIPSFEGKQENASISQHMYYDPAKYFGKFKPLLEKIRSWRKPTGYFGEPAHKQVHYPSNKSIMKTLVHFGVKLLVNDYAIPFEVRRKAVTMLLPKTTFNQSSEEVVELFGAIENSRYASGSKGTSKKAMMSPAHDDEVGDFRSAFENLCVNFPRILRPQRKEIDNSMKEGNFIGDMLKFLKV